MAGISIGRFVAFSLLLFPFPAYASCVVASSGFQNLITTILWLLGLSLIWAFFIRERKRQKKSKQNLKPASRKRYVLLVLGVLCFLALFIRHDISLYTGKVSFGERPYESYPCCSAKTIETNRNFSPEPIQCVGCRVCKDSVAFKPPIKLAQVLEDDMLPEGRQYLLSHLFPTGTDISTFENSLSSLGLKKMDPLCSQSGVDSSHYKKIGFTQYVDPVFSSVNNRMAIVADYAGDKKIASVNVDYVRSSVDHKAPLGALHDLADKGFEEAYHWLSIRYGFRGNKNIKNAPEHYFWQKVYSYFIASQREIYKNYDEKALQSDESFWVRVKRGKLFSKKRENPYQEWLNENLTKQEMQAIEEKAKAYLLEQPAFCASPYFQPIEKVINFIDLYKKAESGDADAQVNLAMMYLNGGTDVTPQKPEKAYEWLEKARSQGNTKAQPMIVEYGLEEPIK